MTTEEGLNTKSFKQTVKINKQACSIIRYFFRAVTRGRGCGCCLGYLLNRWCDSQLAVV